MKPQTNNLIAVIGPLIVALALVAVPGEASAQKRKRKRPPAGEKTPAPKKEKPKDQHFDFTGLQLGGRMRTPQLLYFLDRATEELERASLEKRSFIPEMERSMEDERL